MADNETQDLARQCGYTVTSRGTIRDAVLKDVCNAAARITIGGVKHWALPQYVEAMCIHTSTATPDVMPVSTHTDAPAPAVQTPRSPVRRKTGKRLGRLPRKAVDRVFSTKQVARHIGKTIDVVYRLVREGKLRPYPLTEGLAGSHYQFPEKRLREDVRRLRLLGEID